MTAADIDATTYLLTSYHVELFIGHRFKTIWDIQMIVYDKSNGETLVKMGIFSRVDGAEVGSWRGRGVNELVLLCNLDASSPRTAPLHIPTYFAAPNLHNFVPSYPRILIHKNLTFCRTKLSHFVAPQPSHFVTPYLHSAKLQSGIRLKNAV